MVWLPRGCSCVPHSCSSAQMTYGKFGIGNVCSPDATLGVVVSCFCWKMSWNKCGRGVVSEKEITNVIRNSA